MVVDADERPEAASRTSADVDPYGPRQWHSSLVELAGKNRALNEFSVEQVNEQNDQNLVMLHGPFRDRFSLQLV